jgi:hypothetical protein
MDLHKVTIRIAFGIVTGILVGLVYEGIVQSPGKIAVILLIWAGIGAVMGALHRRVLVAVGGIAGIGAGALVGRWLGGGIALAIAVLGCEMLGATMGKWIDRKTRSGESLQEPPTD